MAKEQKELTNEKVKNYSFLDGVLKEISNTLGASLEACTEGVMEYEAIVPQLSNTK